MVSEIIKHKVSICLSDSTHGYIPRGIETDAIKKLAKECLLQHCGQNMKIIPMIFNRLMNKHSWHVQIVECYLAVKRNEVLVDAATWINLENIRLSQRSQSQNTYAMISFI